MSFDPNTVEERDINERLNKWLQKQKEIDAKNVDPDEDKIWNVGTSPRPHKTEGPLNRLDFDEWLMIRDKNLRLKSVVQGIGECYWLTLSRGLEAFGIKDTSHEVKRKTLDKFFSVGLSYDQVYEIDAFVKQDFDFSNWLGSIIGHPPFTGMTYTEDNFKKSVLDCRKTLESRFPTYGPYYFLKLFIKNKTYLYPPTFLYLAFPMAYPGVGVTLWHVENDGLVHDDGFDHRSSSPITKTINLFWRRHHFFLLEDIKLALSHRDVTNNAQNISVPYAVDGERLHYWLTREWSTPFERIQLVTPKDFAWMCSKTGTKPDWLNNDDISKLSVSDEEVKAMQATKLQLRAMTEVSSSSSQSFWESLSVLLPVHSVSEVRTVVTNQLEKLHCDQDKRFISHCNSFMRTPNAANHDFCLWYQYVTFLQQDDGESLRDFHARTLQLYTNSEEQRKKKHYYKEHYYIERFFSKSIFPQPSSPIYLAVFECYKKGLNIWTKGFDGYLEKTSTFPSRCQNHIEYINLYRNAYGQYFPLSLYEDEMETASSLPRSHIDADDHKNDDRLEVTFSYEQRFPKVHALSEEIPGGLIGGKHVLDTLQERVEEEVYSIMDEKKLDILAIMTLLSSDDACSCIDTDVYTKEISRAKEYGIEVKDSITDSPLGCYEFDIDSVGIMERFPKLFANAAEDQHDTLIDRIYNYVLDTEKDLFEAMNMKVPSLVILINLSDREYCAEADNVLVSEAQRWGDSTSDDPTAETTIMVQYKGKAVERVLTSTTASNNVEIVDLFNDEDSNNDAAKTISETISASSTTIDLRVASPQGQKVNARPSLTLNFTAGYLNLIEQCLLDAEKGSEGDIMFRHESAIFTKRSMRTLRPGTILNDEIINGVGVLLQRTFGNNHSFHIVSSYFFSHCLTEGMYDYSKVRTWMKTSDVLKCEFLIFPRNHSFHWTVIFVDMVNHRIWNLDSLAKMKKDKEKVKEAVDEDKEFLTNVILKWLVDKHADEKEPFDSKVWTVHRTPDNLPRQNNGVDCGVFVCCYMFFLCHGVIPTVTDFNQYNMPILRKLLARWIRNNNVC